MCIEEGGRVVRGVVVGLVMLFMLVFESIFVDVVKVGFV